MKSGVQVVNVVVTKGTVKVQCRECARWMTLTLSTEIKVSREDSPEVETALEVG